LSLIRIYRETIDRARRDDWSHFAIKGNGVADGRARGTCGRGGSYQGTRREVDFVIDHREKVMGEKDIF
jgi:hypothetical protein